MKRVSRYVYWFTALLFVVGVIAQVFLAGMVVVSYRMGWDNHVGLGHLLAFPLVIMLLTQYLGQLPRRLKWLTWLLVLVYVLQADVIIFMRTTAPVVAALHPVLALVDFALGLTLVRSAWPLVRQVNEEGSVVPTLETSRRPT
jgi:hypothetical protein